MDSSNAANVSDDEESFYGVFVESDVDNSSKFCPNIFFVQTIFYFNQYHCLKP